MLKSFLKNESIKNINIALHVIIALLTTAGWKLTPMVGAMYSPELYTGNDRKINFILNQTGGDKMPK